MVAKQRKTKQQELDERLDDDVVGDQEKQLLKSIQDTQTSLRKNAKKNKKAPVSESEDESSEADEDLAALRMIQEENSTVEVEDMSDDEMEREVHRRNALVQRLDDIRLNLAFSERMDVVVELPIKVEQVEDDLQREVALYKHALAAVKIGRSLLDDAKVNHLRPIDFMAEMIKSDQHMSRVKQNLLFEKKKIEAFEQRKKQQEYKKFAKKVQSDKIQERTTKKKQIKDLAAEFREKNRNNLDSSSSRKRKLSDKALPNPKRQHKNDKFGFGGKKSRKNDAESLDAPTRAEVRNKKRPGKSLRNNRRG